MTTISPIAPTPGSTTPATSVVDNTEIASNFTTFLTLLTTQLQNQDPLSPMDTNQFTQQLVEFASVEQQMQQNSSLNTLVALEQSAQSTQVLGLVGATVVVDGSTTNLTDSKASWDLNVTKPATATITIKDATGQTAFTGTVAVNPGSQNYTWDGHGNDGTVWPDGPYTISVSATDASGQTTAISTQITARVDSVDLTQNPPLLSINGLTYTVYQLQKIIAPGSQTGAGA